MYKNYLKAAWRNIIRNKSYAIINIAGLATGIAACLLLFLVIQFETGYDNFHKKRDRIYRVCTMLHSQNGLGYSSGCAFPVGAQLRIDFPQIKEVGSIFLRSDHQVIAELGNGQQK